MDSRFKKIVEDVFTEIDRQDTKFGKDRESHPLVWLSVLTEEVGEIAQEINDADFTEANLNGNYRKELIQVAAVALQAALNFDRKLETCIGCDKKFFYEKMSQDNAGENYCPPCWVHFKPLLKAEYDELKANGEIDTDE